MFFRSLVATPVELQRLARAFDEAWIVINSTLPIDPLVASAERQRLSDILVLLWKSTPHSDLAALAAQRFLDGAQHGAGAANADDQPLA